MNVIQECVMVFFWLQLSKKTDINFLKWTWKTCFLSFSALSSYFEEGFLYRKTQFRNTNFLECKDLIGNNILVKQISLFMLVLHLPVLMQIKISLWCVSQVNICDLYVKQLPHNINLLSAYVFSYSYKCLRWDWYYFIFFCMLLLFKQTLIISVNYLKFFFIVFLWLFQDFHFSEHCLPVSYYDRKFIPNQNI